MSLTAMDPDEAATDAEADVLAALGRPGLTYRVWGGDWCPDCRERLPPFAAALAAAGVSPDRIETYPVEKTADGKAGPGVEAYGVDYVPTVVVGRDGAELARFVESAAVPIATALARDLDAALGGGDGETGARGEVEVEVEVDADAENGGETP